MYAYYMKEMYIGNRLREPGALTCSASDRPSPHRDAHVRLCLARRPHRPWRSAYRTTGCWAADGVTILAGESGHHRRVVNPPLPSRRNYWSTSSSPTNPRPMARACARGARQLWTHWDPCLPRTAAATQEAPGRPRQTRLPRRLAHPAPGSYVWKMFPSVSDPLIAAPCLRLSFPVRARHCAHGATMADAARVRNQVQSRRSP
jgi:polyhydroxyalkanoate synthase